MASFVGDLDDLIAEGRGSGPMPKEKPPAPAPLTRAQRREIAWL